MMMLEENPLAFCCCGCGEQMPLFDISDHGVRIRRFSQSSHAGRGKSFRTFLSKIRKTDSCWESTASKMINGYHYGGKINGKEEASHRFSWIFHFGAIPEGKRVLHKCDNRSCVNPDHLFLGDGLDNVHDAISKGRMRGKAISNQDVLDIRQMFENGMTKGSIARRKECSRASIYLILNGTNRRNVFQTPKGVQQ